MTICDIPTHRLSWTLQQYREGFGLPAGVVRHTEAVDPMSLAGILYALYLQVAHNAVPHEDPFLRLPFSTYSMGRAQSPPLVQDDLCDIGP